MNPRFELKNSRHGRVARLTVAVADAQRSRLERRVARMLKAECATRGFGVVGNINIEVQENWLTTKVDVTAAAFVAASTARRPASSATAASGPTRRRTSAQAMG